ncbi:hypothetical protein ACFLZ2_04700 [Candidatus Margulisiibacteriota bacterium]
MKRIVLSAMLLILFSSASFAVLWADKAEVLPAGRWVVEKQVKYKNYGDTLSGTAFSGYPTAANGFYFILDIPVDIYYGLSDSLQAGCTVRYESAKRTGYLTPVEDVGSAGIADSFLHLKYLFTEGLTGQAKLRLPTGDRSGSISFGTGMYELYLSMIAQKQMGAGALYGEFGISDYFKRDDGQKNGSKLWLKGSVDQPMTPSFNLIGSIYIYTAQAGSPMGNPVTYYLFEGGAEWAYAPGLTGRLTLAQQVPVLNSANFWQVNIGGTWML